MAEERNSRSKLSGLGNFIFYAFFMLVMVQGWCAQIRTNWARESLLNQLQSERGSRVIAMIHRQDTFALLGIPLVQSISIEDSEAVLRAIRNTPADYPIDLILHTPGGLVLAATQIASALADHKGKVTVFVPHYAMSGGTLLALAADEIAIDRHAVLGPVDPQLGGMPAASILKVLERKDAKDIDDDTLIQADMASKAMAQVKEFVEDLLAKKMPEPDAKALAATLTEGRWTHDFPISVEMARGFGLPVSEELPKLVYELMDLYPQAGGGKPSVMYVPLRREGDRSSSGR
jgi:ClpP class serine protease